MITLKDYAKEHNISYEAVRRSVNRYKEDLEGHIHIEGRTQYLDDAAVEFLDTKRQQNPIVIVNQDKDEELERLRSEKEALLIRIAELQDSLIREKDKVALLQEKNIALLETKVEQVNEIPEKRHWWEFWK